MAIKSNVDWHDLHICPYDLPEDREPILVTVENVLGERTVRSDIYLMGLNNADYCWCVKVNGKDEMAWVKVLAWAYLPSPYPV